MGRTYRRDYPERAVVADELHRAIYAGIVTPWPVCALPECSRTDVEAHHADYSNPLGVTWLCSTHHRRLHGDFRRMQRNAEVANLIRIHLQGEQA